MADPSPALGISVDFPTEQVRNGLLFAMQLGKPNDPARRLTFVLRPSDGLPTYLKNGSPVATPRLDRDGEPLDPEIEVVRAPDREVQVDAAVEVTAATQEELPPIGNFRPSKLTVTLMGQEYVQIQGCKEIRYNGDRYLYGFEPEVDGLFDLDVYQIVFFAIEDA